MASGTWKAASKAGHMAAPTSAVQKLQKILANGEPSTHGLKRLFWLAEFYHN